MSHSSIYKLRELLPSFQGRSLQKFCLTLYTYMIASPAPTSCMVCPVEGLTLPTVFYSVFKLVF